MDNKKYLLFVGLITLVMTATASPITTVGDMNEVLFQLIEPISKLVAIVILVTGMVLGLTKGSATFPIAGAAFASFMFFGLTAVRGMIEPSTETVVRNSTSEWGVGIGLGIVLVISITAFITYQREPQYPDSSAPPASIPSIEELPQSTSPAPIQNDPSPVPQTVKEVDVVRNKRKIVIDE